MAGVCLVSMLPAPSAQAAPALRLIAPGKAVEVDRYEGQEGVAVPLGAYLAADREFRLKVVRPSYGRPLVITQDGRRLRQGLAKDFTGFKGFFTVTFKNAAGRTVKTLSHTFCPNGDGSRIERTAKPTNKYPPDCGGNAFALGSVWGIQRGWAVTAGYTEPVDLKPGTYTAVVAVSRKFKSVFGIAGKPVRFKLTVNHVELDEDETAERGRREQVLKAGRAPSGEARVPKGPKPDLRALPAWDVTTDTESADPTITTPGRDYLRFSSNVWNAGPSTIVVDGFRRGSSDDMVAYQYFYDTKGREVGYAKTGGFQWDPRDGHTHWHFKDFAAYSLVKSNKKVVVRSRKEAFCLANTDPVDLTRKGAVWRPQNTDLSSSCGDQASLSVRQVLDVGQGDTYSAGLPGQEFDITGVPNGTYYIQVRANPKGRLFETSTANNVSYRKVILGGVKGARTVRVPKVGLIGLL